MESVRRITSILALFVALLFGFGCSQQTQKPYLTAAEFTDAYVTTLKTANPHLSFEKVAELEIHLNGPIQSDYNVFLTNAYNEYRQSPGDLNEILIRFTNAIQEKIHSPQLDMINIKQIVPIIKDTEFLEEIRRVQLEVLQSANGTQYYHEPLNEHLLVFYGLDTDFNTTFLSRDEIDSIDIQPADLRTLAIKNLNGLIPGIEIHGQTGTFIITAGGTYEASLLLFESIWSEEKLSVNGEIVIAIPSRDLLLVTGSRDTKGLERLRKTVDSTFDDGSYVVSDKLFILRDNQWLLFEE